MGKNTSRRHRQPVAFPTAGLVMALAAVLLLSLVFGCASQAQASPGTGAPAQANFSSVDKTGITTADNRTSYDKTQQAIVAAVADGTYFKEVQYAYHSGIESVDFNITVKNDIATAVSVNAPHPNMMSARIISSFSAALPDLVVGKKMEDISLPRNVAGSSLTSAAFQHYVDSLVGRQQ